MELKAIASKEVFEKILRKEELTILDVRNEEEYADWKIEGETVKSVNIPYFDLLEGIEPALDQLPADKPVLVVCAKEGSSKYVAEQLAEAGRKDVSYLEGGMKAWSEYLRPVKIGDLKDGGALYQFVRVGKGCLSYLVVSNQEAAIIDSMRMTEPYEQFAAEHNLQIKHAIDTHLHADHISGGRKLAEQLGAAYWLPAKDATEATFAYHPLEDGHDITVGTTTVKIQPIYSPGHTIGSTSLLVDDTYLLTGDILFVASIGRPDLAGKAEDWVDDLRNTLYSLYSQLPKDLVVLPAHYAHMSEMDDQGRVWAMLGELYKTNAGLQIEQEERFRRLVTENLPPQPNAYQEIRLTNMGKMSPDEEEQREMEIGPNRCAVHE